MTEPLAGHEHRFDRGAIDGPTLLALHGTGGDENDLVPLARMLLPGAAILSPRGRVLESGMPRFFRRLAEGVFDQADLEARTHDLAAFIAAAAERYGFDPAEVVVVGYSNGANIAASLMLRGLGPLRGAVLFRAMVPFEPERTADLHGTPVFLGSGRHDPIVPSHDPERLARLLRAAGADVTLRWDEGGHPLERASIEAAREWLATTVAGSRRS